MGNCPCDLHVCRQPSSTDICVLTSWRQARRSKKTSHNATVVEPRAMNAVTTQPASDDKDAQVFGWPCLLQARSQTVYRSGKQQEDAHLHQSEWKEDEWESHDGKQRDGSKDARCCEAAGVHGSIHSE